MAATIASSFRKLSSTMPSMQIHISNPQTIYTTNSTICGTVTIKTVSPTPYSSISITLEGKANTEMERVSLAGSDTRIKTNHNFLKLVMPIDESTLPGHELPAGETFSIPFTFVVPSRLLPHACNHKTVGEWVHEDHLQMPPSMGAPLPGLDDMSSDMAKISYSVNAKIFSVSKRTALTAKSPSVLCHISKPLHIIPRSSEIPPLTFDLIDNDYILSTTKPLRKSLFKATKLGSLTLSSFQPASLITSPITPAASTVAHVKLHFTPSAPGIMPPKLSTLTTKIKSTTFYSIKPHETLPTLANMVSSWDSNRAVYEMSTLLSTRDVSSVTWSPMAPKPPTYLRRHSDDSGYSTASSDDLSPDFSPVNFEQSSNVEGEYEACITVPIMLPSGKSWLPSFQSCLIGRTYQLEFGLHVSSGGFGGTVLAVRVPVQVAVGGQGEKYEDFEITDVELPDY